MLMITKHQGKVKLYSVFCLRSEESVVYFKNTLLKIEKFLKFMVED